VIEELPGVVVIKAQMVRDRLDATGIGTGKTDVLTEPPTLQTVTDDLARLSEAGLAKSGVTALLAGDPDPDTINDVLDEALDALEHNPLPDTEWEAVRTVLGDDILGALVGVSPVSLRRYAGGERRTPDHVAARLHFVALVNADLAGSYNDLGARRWWGRPRGVLGGLCPSDALEANWDPDRSDTAAKIRALAASLVAAGSAT
jgi:hypothetical protein